MHKPEIGSLIFSTPNGLGSSPHESFSWPLIGLTSDRWWAMPILSGFSETGPTLPISYRIGQAFWTAILGIHPGRSLFLRPSC